MLEVQFLPIPPMNRKYKYIAACFMVTLIIVGGVYNVGTGLAWGTLSAAMFWLATRND